MSFLSAIKSLNEWYKAYNHNIKKRTKKIGDKIVLIKIITPNNPDKKNIIKEIDEIESFIKK